MALSNYERMMEMAKDTFANRIDDSQLSIDEKVLERLHQLHPATVSEYDDGNGPAVWILLIPTTLELMHQFLKNKISEKELYELTPLNIKYEAIYLCSAIVLPEHRGKGIAKQLSLAAIESMRKGHPIKALFVWAFSKQGEGLAQKVSNSSGLPLYKR